MKYTLDIEINKPIDEVIKLFDSSENITKWMEGLKSFEHLEGTPGKPGAKSVLKFELAKRKFEMVETVIALNLPEEFTASYETPDGAISTVKNSFVALSENQTKYISDNSFEMKGLMMRIIAFLMPGMFKKQTMKYLVAFKEFAEGN